MQNTKIYFAVICIFCIISPGGSLLATQNQEVHVSITRDEEPKPPVHPIILTPVAPAPTTPIPIETTSPTTPSTSTTTLSTTTTTPTTTPSTTSTTPTPTTQSTTSPSTTCKCESVQPPIKGCNGNIVYNFFDRLFPGYFHHKRTTPESSTTVTPTSRYYPISSYLQSVVQKPKAIYQNPNFVQHGFIEKTPNDDLKDVAHSLLSEFRAGSYDSPRTRNQPKSYRKYPAKPYSYVPRSYHRSPINNPVQYSPKRYQDRLRYEEDYYYDEDYYDDYYDYRRLPHRRYHRHVEGIEPMRNLGVKKVD